MFHLGGRLEEKRELVDSCLKKSTREVERELAKRNPDIQKIEMVKPIGLDRFQVSFSISEATEEKMKKLKGLFAHTNPNMTTEELFEKLIDLGLEKFDPARKASRAMRRLKEADALKSNRGHSAEAARSDEPVQSADPVKQVHSVKPIESPEPVESSQTANSSLLLVKAADVIGSVEKADQTVQSLHAHEIKGSQKFVVPKERARSIAAAVKHAVWRRNQDRGCEFVSDAGEACGSHQALQIDHVNGFALGGSNEVKNLRIICAKHNRFIWKAQMKAAYSAVREKL